MVIEDREEEKDAFIYLHHSSPVNGTREKSGFSRFILKSYTLERMQTILSTEDRFNDLDRNKRQIPSEL